jgi:hypothetical protein
MSKRIFKLINLSILLFSFQIIANAQNDQPAEKKDRNIIVIGATETLKVGGKISYIVVKESAKIAWKTTKFTAGEVAAPVAKAIVVKVAPKVTIFMLKQSGNVIERATPLALKAAITYLKL